MIESLLSYFKKRARHVDHKLIEEQREKNYWAWQEAASKTVLKNLSAYTRGEWVYRQCKDLLYTQGVQCFIDRHVMIAFVNALGNMIYCLHRKPYYDHYKVLLNISRDKKCSFYVRNQHNNALIYHRVLSSQAVLPTIRVIPFQLKRVKQLSAMQRLSMNFDNDEDIDYVYGLSLWSEK